MSNSPVPGINSGGNGISTRRDRMIRLATLSIPMIGNAILSQMINLITMLYVGRLDGAVYMGAATLGNML
jgi:Na+-driven multidrug efflux pump